MMADNVVFLEPGDERAQKIAKAMGSQTAGDILQILGEGPQSLTDITDRLSIPMNTAKYHVENLLDAGLIAVAETRYSVKGREVKIYTLSNQLLIVAPRRADARSLLLKYATLFGVVALGTALIAALSPLLSPVGFVRGSANQVNTAPPYAAVSPEAGAAAKGVAESIVQNVTSAANTLATGTLAAADNLAVNVSPALASTHATAVPASLPTSAAAAVAPVPSPLPPGTLGTGAGTVLPGLDPAIAFFLGGALVIFILACYEAWLWKRKKS